MPVLSFSNDSSVAGNGVFIMGFVPGQSVERVVAYARANPGRVNVGIAGSGSSQHFAAALFEHQAQVQFTHIIYRGGAPAMTDLVAGRVDIVFSPIVETIQQTASTEAIGDGKVFVLDLVSAVRIRTGESGDTAL